MTSSRLTSIPKILRAGFLAVLMVGFAGTIALRAQDQPASAEPKPAPDSVNVAGTDREERTMSASIITRIQVGDYAAWRPMFDQDRPKAREKATVQRVFRSVDDPSNVFIHLEFASLADAEEARKRLVESGVLDRFDDKDGPNVVEEA